MLVQRNQRRGATVVEFAVIVPITILLLFGLLVGGMGIFRYQQVAHLAREASRHAAVRGTLYASETGNTAATEASIYRDVIAPGSTAMDLSQLTYSVTWDTSNSPSRTTNVNGVLVTKANIVTVTVTYRWIPEVIFGGGTMTSTSKCTMYY